VTERQDHHEDRLGVVLVSISGMNVVHIVSHVELDRITKHACRAREYTSFIRQCMRSRAMRPVLYDTMYVGIRMMEGCRDLEPGLLPSSYPFGKSSPPRAREEDMWKPVLYVNFATGRHRL